MDNQLPLDDWKKQLEEWNKETKEMIPEADETVMQFITNFATHSATTYDEYEVIRSTFRAGYCYYFASMLKLAFKRGEVCWMAPFSHFVWVDDNGVAYDIEGVLDGGEQDYYIPESYLGESVKDFLHIPGKDRDTSKEEIVEIIRHYEDDNNLPHIDYTKFLNKKPLF